MFAMWSCHCVQARMHSYVESVSLAVPMYGGEERAMVGASRPNRMKLVGGALAVLACSAMILSAFTTSPGEGETELLPKITPKFVDWKKEDAGSDDMNLHLKVADALARADGLAEKSLSPVPEKLLKEAQQAAEEQRSMPGLDGSEQKAKKPKIPASLEKMFQQAEAEQKVEKIAKEGDRKRDEEAKEAKEAKSKKAAVKAAAAKKIATSKAEKSASMKLLKQVSQDAASSSHKKLAKVSKKK